MSNAHDPDPYLWLEDVTGEKPLEWVRERNVESVKALAETTDFAALEARIRSILDSKDRIPLVSKIGPHFYNFWRDARNPKGVWRRTTLEEYRKPDPAWETVLDLDALAEKEGENWVWHGAAVLEPERWSKVVSMAVPPGGAVGLAFATNLAQLKRSWYMFFFQHGLSDLVVPANDLAFIDMIWADWSPGHDGAADAELVKQCLRDPAHLAAALGYYRATLGDGYKDPALDALQAATSGIPTQPMLYLHGADDGCIGVEVAESAKAMVTPNVAVEIVPGCGHFLQVERPDVVNARIMEFLA